MTDIFSRLEQTRVFRGDGMRKWRSARCGIIGCGLLGGRLATEVVRSGADVWVCDFERGESHNLGTQTARPGILKAHSVVADCNRIRSGSAQGVATDIRHVGIGTLQRCDILIDCTDDAALAMPLTTISNGLGIPLLRAAVDGSGDRELGRVLCSVARSNGACQLCSHSIDDLWRATHRTPCPGRFGQDRTPTLAGGAVASVVCGLALLQAQRLITGIDLEQVRNRESIIDLTSMCFMNAQLTQSAACISGHDEWNLVHISSTRLQTINDIFTEAKDRLQDEHPTIEPFGHPFCLEAFCECGQTTPALGTQWATPPPCSTCKSPTAWRLETQRMRINQQQTTALGATTGTLAQLGFPLEGAMFTAGSADTKSICHLILI